MGVRRRRNNRRRVIAEGAAAVAGVGKVYSGGCYGVLERWGWMRKQMGEDALDR